MKTEFKTTFNVHIFLFILINICMYSMFMLIRIIPAENSLEYAFLNNDPHIREFVLANLDTHDKAIHMSSENKMVLVSIVCLTLISIFNYLYLNIKIIKEEFNSLFIMLFFNFLLIIALAVFEKLMNNQYYVVNMSLTICLATTFLGYYIGSSIKQILNNFFDIH